MFAAARFGDSTKAEPRLRRARGLGPLQCPAAQASWHAFKLSASDIFFERVRMLQANKFNRKAILDIAGDAGLGLANGNERTDHRPLVARDTRARLRYIDNATVDMNAVRKNEPSQWVALRT